MSTNKLLYWIPLILLSATGIAQEKTKAKKTEAAFKTLKTTEDKPLYKVTVEDAKIPYRIFINDIPLASINIQGRFAFFANTAILKSGNQQIRVEAGNKKSAPAELKVNLSESGWQKGGGTKPPKTLWEYNGKGPLQGAFSAEIPTQLHDSEQSASIAKEDKEKISRAEAWFRQMAAYMLIGKGTAFMDNLIPAEMITFQANHFIPEQALDQHNSWKDYINKGGVKLADRKASKIEIVGNGKLIHLVNPGGEGALAIIHGKRKTVFDIFIHFPQGKQDPEALLLNMLEY